jgi:hypothetical protein
LPPNPFLLSQMLESIKISPIALANMLRYQEKSGA